VTVSAGNDTELLTTREVAELCGVDEGTVRRWRFDGDLPYVRLGYRTVRHLRADVEEFIWSRRRVM
jgi:excisionase family DNA binding protein